MTEDRLLGALLSDTRPLVRRLLAEPILDLGVLARDLEACEARIREAAGPTSLADDDTGLELVARCRQLLARSPGLDHRGQRLVQVAVRYLVIEDDGDDDVGSPFGFDDDREVVDAVFRELGA